MTTENKIIPDDYNDWIYRITYRALSKVAPYIPRSVHPNTITYFSFASALLGCAILYFCHTPVAYLYWIVFNYAWFLLDALDGMHARLTNQTSEFGGFLDHFLDNIYFAILFPVLAVKFDLGYTIYIFAISLRITAALMVFLVQAHRRRVYLGAATGGLELILFTSVMLLSYFLPHFNPSMHTTSHHLLYLINILHLQSGFFMKVTWFVYIIGVPIHMIEQVRFVKQHLAEEARKEVLTEITNHS